MKTYTYKYPKPSVTTDCILINQQKSSDQLLLIRRKHDPYMGKWALPGGFVEIDEDLLDGAERELLEETGLKDIELVQFKTYGKPERDPRGRTISIVYYGYFKDSNQKVNAGDDAAEACWFNLNELPTLAFDHELILAEFADFMNSKKN